MTPAPDQKGDQRRTLIFTGHVQGVGFRQTTQRLARQRRLGGTVRNLANGDVELIVEGPVNQIDDLVEAIGQAMRGHIQSTRETIEPASGAFGGFDIRR